MRSMIQESLKEMREIGARRMEIERIRYRLRRENAPKEAFQDLDRRHQTELNLLKIYQKHFVIGIALAFFLVVLGIFRRAGAGSGLAGLLPK
jgi:regulator of replication initiation timing